MRLWLARQPACFACSAARRQPQRGRRLEKSRSSEGQLVVTRHRGAEALGGAGLADDAARPAFGPPELLLQGHDGPPAAVRGQKFPRFSSFSMSMSRA